jgi:hypothetical protein
MKYYIMPFSLVSSAFISLLSLLSVPVRIPPVLLYGACVYVGHDLPCLTSLWIPKPISIRFHLLPSWLHLDHGYQRVWRCPQINSRW